jgi:hypothetical protein
VPTVTVNAVAKTVGIRAVESGKDFYWSKGDPIISQDSGGVKLSTSQTLRVVYYGQYPSVVVAQNSAQISYQASLDGTSGIIEDVDNDSTLTSAEAGLSKVSSLLNRYATQGIIFEFSTLDTSYAPGQLRTFDIEPFGLSMAQMLIASVVASDQTDGINIWYRVKAIKGPYDNTWIQFFGELVKQVQPATSINIGVNQTTVILTTGTMAVTATMSMEAYEYACPLPSTALFPSTTLFPC